MLLFTAAVSIVIASVAQADSTESYYLEEPSISLDLPASVWHQPLRQETNRLVVYIFKREPVKDPDNRQVIPNIAVITETIPEESDVVTYSIQKKLKTPFDIDEVFTHDDGWITYLNAIGYKGSYIDDNSLPHTIFMVYAIHATKGIQIILDTTTGTYDQIEKEFLIVLKSIRNGSEN